MTLNVFYWAENGSDGVPYLRGRTERMKAATAFRKNQIQLSSAFSFRLSSQIPTVGIPMSFRSWKLWEETQSFSVSPARRSAVSSEVSAPSPCCLWPQRATVADLLRSKQQTHRAAGGLSSSRKTRFTCWVIQKRLQHRSSEGNKINSNWSHLSDLSWSRLKKHFCSSRFVNFCSESLFSL